MVTHSSTTSRRWILGGSAIYLGILAVVVLGLVLLYLGARNRLDESLGERLIGIAVTATELVDADQIETWSLDPDEPVEFVWLATRLEQIRQSNNLAELTLCDPDAFVLISASGRLPRGEINAFWELDRAAVNLALEGFPAASHLYDSGGLFQKSAHAPVFDNEGKVAAIITAEAAVDFFDTLATLRDGALTTGAIVVAFLVFSALAIWRLYRAQERFRADLVRQENLAAMGRMTAGIAHEIRNPLGVIRGTGQHLQRRLRDAGIDDPMADFIPEEIDRLDRILSGYLSFGTNTETEHEAFDLNEVVRRTIQLMSNEFSESGVTIDSSAAELPVIGDRQRVQQVLMNLLLNARDAMPEGGTVQLMGRHEGTSCILTVSDEGPGLGGVDPETLFTAFHTNKEKGSGLGLALSRQIAEAHGGTLTLKTRTDRAGAVATLTLPAAGNEA
jgi:signal transduction histidine kinase